LIPMVPYNLHKSVTKTNDSPGEQHCYLCFLCSAEYFLRQTFACIVILLHGSANIKDIFTLVVHVTELQNIHTMVVSEY